MDKPVHQHDCDACIFLGLMSNKEQEAQGRQVDLYLHPPTNEDFYDCTFIARYSSEGGDYSSGNEFCWSNPYLNQALRMAYEKGMLKGELLAGLRHEQQRWLNYCEKDVDYKARIDERYAVEHGTERFLLPPVASN